MNAQESSNRDTGNEGRQLVRREFSSFSGPLPPPEILERYDRIVPGAAERILKMAEQQSRHRQELETKVINSDIINSKLGLVFGLVVGLGGLVAGVFMVKSGQPVAGTIIGGGTLVGLVSAFIYGSQKRKEEREGKRN